MLFTAIHEAKQNKIFVQTFRCAVALWKSWVCKYSIRFQVIKLKLLCETLKNEKWKILAWYPNKMRRYRQPNPKCGDWRWTNFQMQVALWCAGWSLRFSSCWSYSSTELFLSIWHGTAVSWNLINFQVTNQVSEIND